MLIVAQLPPSSGAQMDGIHPGFVYISFTICQTKAEQAAQSATSATAYVHIGLKATVENPWGGMEQSSPRETPGEK